MDQVWWKEYGAEARKDFLGEMWSASTVPGVHKLRGIVTQNSGAGAVALAARCGARRVLLLGYDCQLTSGRAHWHGDHPRGLGNAGSVRKWPAQFRALARQLPDTQIINCSRETALTVFPVLSLEEALAC